MLSPQEIPQSCINVAKTKANLPLNQVLLLSIMAGIFIGFGAVGYNAGGASVPLPSVARLIGACIFPAGLTMVLIAGSELFTGNNLMPIGVWHREITWWPILRNWAVVFTGNFIGSIFLVLLCYYGGHFKLFGGAMAVVTIKTAVAKLSYSFSEALILGFLCNVLVCLAVWMSYAGATVSEKIAALFFPIMIFVLAGFEHSVANMYFIPAGIFAASNSAWAEAAQAAGLSLEGLTWSHFVLANLLPVTIGNILGGAFVGGMYWLVYHHCRHE